MTELSKKWGRTSRLPNSDDRDLWLARITAGGFSSRHLHQHLHNIFTVLDGVLLVREYKEDSPDDVWRIHTLNQGASVRIAAGKIHQFEALTDVVLLEAYMPVTEDYRCLCSLEDITRLDEGGVRIPA